MFSVKEELADLRYSIVYTEPLLDLITEKIRNSVIKKIMTSFAVNLNNIKFRNDLPSDKYIYFNKFLGETFVDVSIGVQELSVIITRFQDKKQGFEILNKTINTIKAIKGFEIGYQKFTLSQHYSSDQDSDMFFQNLNSITPKEFTDTLKNQGVVYHLVNEENNCNTSLLVDSSLVFAGGVFLNAELIFHPNKLSFNEMFAFAQKKYSEITLALGMDIK